MLGTTRPGVTIAVQELETEGLGAQHESAATPQAAGAQNALDATGDAISSELRSSVSIWRRTACERHQ